MTLDSSNNPPPAQPRTRVSPFLIQLSCWLVLTLLFVGVFIWTAFADYTTSPSSTLAFTKKMLLPGETTHGHYQIELACNACHTPNMGVKQDACLDCHKEELKTARDTHPASKFSDPTNAERLQVLDTTLCITCHREHVPERTHPMGLSLPTDYCYHCHQDVMKDRPSHADFTFNSCATAGCHNYHDNRALYENFLFKHADEQDILDEPKLEFANFNRPEYDAPLTTDDQDAPAEHRASGALLHDWAETLHARAGVNCNACHLQDKEIGWQDKVTHETCAQCHESAVEGWLKGHHGMRIASGLPAMTPAEARLPMKSATPHERLDCSSCHGGHRFDTRHAAVDACVSCHNDRHSLAYKNSSHFTLWQQESEALATDGAGQGGGVSCATCHMPRCENEDGETFVQHNQNDNLRPNEKMIRSVCMQCHGVSFSINALADTELIDACFSGPSKIEIESVEMVKRWFESRKRK